MMTPFTVYDATTGAIAWSGNCQAELLAEQASEAGQAAIAQASDPHAQYVDLATLTVADRLTMTVTPTITTGQVELSGLPVPCVVTVDGLDTEVDDGVATITFDEPGDYTLTITARPRYFDHTLEVSIP